MSSTIDCRACAKSEEIKNMISLYKDENTATIFCACTSLEIKESDCLPTHICTDCDAKLMELYEFRLKCLAADKLHRDRLIVKDEKDALFPKEEEEEALVDIRFVKVELQADDDFTDDHFQFDALSDAESVQDESEVLTKRSTRSSKIIKNDKVTVKREKKSTTTKKNQQLLKDKESKSDSEENDCKNSEKVVDSKSDILELEEYGEDQINEANNELPFKQQCHLCSRYFNKTHQLLAHMRQHQGLEPFECSICKKTYCDWGNLKIHITSTHSTKQSNKKIFFRCTHKGCGKKYTTKSKLSEHITRIHKSSTEKTNQTDKKVERTGKYICDICGKCFFVRYRIEGHLRQHVGLKAFECVPCEKSFQKYRSFKTHNEVHHGDKEFIRFQCKYPGCEKSYSLDETLKRHYDIIHLGKRRARAVSQKICEQCGKSFTNAFRLKEHSLVHLGYQHYPHECKICAKKFACKKSLKNHILRHDGIKSHICPICGVGKTTKGELRNHLHSHVTEKTISCEKCPSMFNSMKNLKRHIKIVHLGYKPYKCTYCDQSFSKSETQRNHIMTHTGEKPHACTVCDKRFIQSVAMKAHMKTHLKQQQR